MIPTLEFRKDIEGLRGVAILIVIAAHANIPGFSGGFIGVDIFFVISGFLITGILAKETSHQNKIDFVRFYARRFRRLLPALALVIITTGLAIRLLLPLAEQLNQARAAASAIFWVSNFYFVMTELNYFDNSLEVNTFLHTWSLGVEEQFYLIWPALIAITYFFHRSIKPLKLYITIILVISLVACIYLSQQNPTIAFYMMPLRAWQFATGALIFLLSKKIGGFGKSASTLCGWLGLVIIATTTVFLSRNFVYPSFWAILPTVGAALLLIAGTSHAEHSAGKILCISPLQTVGKISYSWYLWHWPVLVIGSILLISNDLKSRILLVALSWILASVTYYFFENPIRHWRFLSKRSGWQITASLLTMLIIGINTSQWHDRTRQQVARTPSDLYMAAKSDLPIIYQMGCDDWYESVEVKICRFGAMSPSKTAVIMGDSIGLQWFPALAKIFTTPGWELLVITKSACPMIDEVIFYPRIGREYTECSVWRDNAIVEIAKIKPDILIIGSAENYDFAPSLWKSGTQKLLSKISPHAKELFVIRATPTLPYDGPQCLTKAALDLTRTLEFQCQPVEVSAKNANIWQSITESINNFENVYAIDMTNIVCPNNVCTAEKDNVVVFRDTQHLTATYIESTYRELKKHFN